MPFIYSSATHISHIFSPVSLYNMEYENKLPESKYECLLFDVDDTLYPLSSGLSVECTKNIKEYMVDRLDIEESKVPEMCARLYTDYGTTMAGLRALGYDFDHDDYHRFVHGRLPYEYLQPDAYLRSLLNSLPIRKVIFSNANEAHVAEVLGRLGLEDCFDDVICFETLNTQNQTTDAPIPTTSVVGDSLEPVGLVPTSPIVCKPSENAFQLAFKMANINPHETLFFDDSIRNIQTAKLTGLSTVLVGSSQRKSGVDYALESIHNIKEALPELGELVNKSKDVRKIAIETPVEA
ncbi:putative pyridoxal phosphatase [Helianthus annuus]|uniref:Putative HAD hydrolase, subfamily IA, Pyrimidine 5-nucleotidase n=1 Tax=Helianthus annuus TaxID=4232 RepID=A0A251UML4_HELAN|nr:putative pyridoxal phosphatase [Helianthus annuus]KAJ0583448.1 putative pyridoxal phosphatase [Helianthus annuus]KAJ0749188.1 putative pyridoxal phosphatase [Helianthus annuus]